MNSVLVDIGIAGVVPTVMADETTDGAALLAALSDGGLPLAEFSVQTAAGLKAIRSASAAWPEAAVGAADVTNRQELDAAIDAGARFVSSPDLSETLVHRARERGVELVPGCALPSDVARASTLGLEFVRFCPSDAAAGPALLKTLEADFPDVRFWPTGGIERSAMGRYLADRQVLAVSGSWIARPELARMGDWAAIAALARDTVRAIHRFHVVHVGISSLDATDADAVARRFGTLFGFDVELGNSSNFASKGIEVMKGRSRGELGHIAIGTTNILRAVSYLSRQGIQFIPASEKRAPDGSLKAVYLSDEVAGFALHLLQAE